MTTELTLPQRAAVALGAAEHEKQLALLVEESKNIKEIKNVDARSQCHATLMSLKNARVAITTTGKAAREDAQAFSKAIIAEEKRLIGITQAEEDRLQALRDKWDADREEERQAKIEAERQRVEELKAMIDDIRLTVMDAVGKSAAAIQEEITRLSALNPGETFQEFRGEAIRARDESLARLSEMLAARRAEDAEQERLKAEQEAEAARLKAEREELSRLRAEAEARRVEQERIAAEERRKQEAELAAQRAEMARQQAERDAVIAAQDKAAKEAQEAAEAKIAAERAELDRQQAEFAARQQAVLEAAQRRRDEEQAEQQRTAPIAPVVEMPPRLPVVESTPPTLRLGQIGERLGFTLTADFVTSLGFPPAATDKSAKLYREADFPLICAALVNHITQVQEKIAA